MAKFFLKKKSGGKRESVLNLLQNVARQSRTHTARHLLDTGLYAGQETIIDLLANNKSMTPSEIARELGVRPPTITKSINRLAEQGFVERTVGHADGRQVRIELTSAGKDVLKKMKKAARKAEKQSLKGLSKNQVSELATSLQSISDVLAARDEKKRTRESN